jgi:ketosteroid isomerase-like protein
MKKFFDFLTVGGSSAGSIGTRPGQPGKISHSGFMTITNEVGMNPRLLLLVLCCTCLAGFAPNALSAGKAATVEDEIRRIIIERKQAAASGDAARWGKHIAEDCVWVGDSEQRASKAEVAAENAINDGTRIVPTVLDLQVRQSGDTVAATYIQEDRSTHNGKTVLARYMYLDTYARRGQR